MVKFRQFFSIDSAKAIKAQKYGYLNAINYMAPHKSGGVGNLCPHASPACIDLCLGPNSGRGVMNSVKISRAAKAFMFMKDRKAFMAEMVAAIDRAIVTARNKGLTLVARPNGSSDVPWEAIAANEARESIFALYPTVQFVDYTKNKYRALKHARGQMPANYHLTFSRSEENEADCLEVLEAGGQVAVVSALPRPVTWNGYATVDGDEHDLRHLNPRGAVVWLSPKGAKAKKDMRGFVLR